MEKQKAKPNKVSSRGGKRNGAGRPKGSGNKVSPEELLADFKKQSGMHFDEFVNKQIIDAHNAGNHELVSRYILGMVKYYVSDVQKVDVTSNGEPIGVSINFTPQELIDWKKS